MMRRGRGMVPTEASMRALPSLLHVLVTFAALTSTCGAGAEEDTKAGNEKFVKRLCFSLDFRVLRRPIALIMLPVQAAIGCEGPPVRPCNGIIEAMGNTPLIKLKRASEETGCTILGKAEFMNPGQSVKDRAALFIIRDALNSGRLQPGGTVVEGTAGNTG